MDELLKENQKLKEEIKILKFRLSKYEVVNENKNVINIKEMDDIKNALKNWKRFLKNPDGTFKLDANGDKMEKPPPSDKTIREYINVIKRAGVRKPEDISILEDFDKVKEDVESRVQAPTSRTTNFIAIVSVLSALDLYPEAREKYRQLMQKGNEQYKKDNETGIISKKQEEAFATKKEFDDMVCTMCKELILSKTPNLDETQALQDYILVKLYQQYQVRNELATLKKITKEDFDKLPEGSDKKNYLVIDGKKMYISLNDYKTDKTFGENVLKIKPDLKKLFNNWFKYYNKDKEHVFMQMNGDPFNTNNLSKALARITKKYMGKSISTRMIRKIFASHEFAETKEKQEKKAKQMGHSTQTQNLIYVKKKPKKKDT
tara:strand:- start:2176 stop:3300 length:1125 start_codon:yes stop_codon:yes gene_type:complete